MDDDAAAAIGKDDPLEATFEMPGCGEPFVLQATIKNKTPASKGCTILGLQFVSTAEAAGQLTALKELLENPTNSRPTVEACI